MLKKFISLFLVIFILITMVGCGGGGVVPNTNSDQEPESEGMHFFIDTNPKSDLLCMSGIEYGDNLMILGQKDTEGNILDVDGVAFINELGEGIVIEIDNNGYPTKYIDSDGNEIIYENYTQATVDISVYDSEDNLVEGPITVNIDPDLLTELIQNYNSVKGTLKVRNLARDGNELMHFIADVVPIGWLLIEGAVCVLAAPFPIVAKTVCSAFLLDTVKLIIEEGDPDKIEKLSFLLDTADIGIGIVDTGEGYETSFFGATGEAVQFATDLLDYGAVIEDIIDEHEKFENAIEEQNWQEALIYCKTNSESYNQVLETENAFDKSGFNPDNTTLIITSTEMPKDVSIKNRPIAIMDHDVYIKFQIEVEGIDDVVIGSTSVSTEFLEVYDNKWRLTKSGLLDCLLEELEKITYESNQSPTASFTASGKTTSHTFSSSGSYSVLLTVTDNDGATDSTTKTISVGDSSLSAPTGVDSSDGHYNYMVRTTWNSVSGASYYHVYRATSPTGSKQAIGSWQTSRTYDDTNVDANKKYYYFVKAATSSSGANASPYSAYDEGYRSSKTFRINIFVYPSGYGTTSPPPGSYYASEGSTYVVSAQPYSGHSFKAWAGDVDGSTTAIQTYVIMDSDNKNITANFN